MPISRPVFAISVMLMAAASSSCALQAPPIEQSCSSPLDLRVSNSCIVNQKRLWRGAQPDQRAASALIEIGVKTVVNLELLHDDLSAFESAEIKAGESQQVQYFRVREWEPLVVLAPSVVDGHVAHFLAITDTQPAPLYVHCRSGKNRTGVMVAAYRIYHGASIDAAISEMQKYQGVWSSQDAAYLRTLTPQHMIEIKRQISEWIPKLKRTATIVCAEGKCSASEQKI